MAPFSIPTPSIIPLRLPVFGGPKSIDTKTKIQILCETKLEHEIFYTIDGTKPQPYAGIVQGNKTIKYSSPFCLPAGKMTIKAIAIHSAAHTMFSSVVTKCYEVLKVDCENNETAKVKQSKNLKSNSLPCENKRNSKEEINKKVEKFPDISHKSDASSVNETVTNCLEEAFIGSSDFELESREDSIEDESCFPVNKNVLDINDNIELSDTMQCIIGNSSYENDSVFDVMEKLTHETVQNKDKTNATLTDSGTSIETQFCCLKCDLTLQQCNTCHKMNAISSKFCIGCGEQLLQLCYFCKEWNLTVATFCQFCGKKMGCRMEPYINLNQIDQSVMAKPEYKSAAIQVLPKMTDKCTQTTHDRNLVTRSSRSSSGSRRMPPVSPGRGYWHQQLDYICNHLKSHVYNNVDFRKEISEPCLCEFKSANIIKEEDKIVISLSFTPYVPDKSSRPASEGTKSGDNQQESS